MKQYFFFSGQVLAIMGLVLGVPANNIDNGASTIATRPCSYTTNGAGIASVVCLPSNGRFSGAASTALSGVDIEHPANLSGVASESATSHINVTNSVTSVTSIYTITEVYAIPVAAQAEIVVQCSEGLATATATDECGCLWEYNCSDIENLATTLSPTIATSRLLGPTYSHVVDELPILSTKKRDAVWHPIEVNTPYPINNTSIAAEDVILPWNLPTRKPNMPGAARGGTETARVSIHYTTWSATTGTHYALNTTTITTFAPFPSSSIDPSGNEMSAQSILTSSSEVGFSVQSNDESTSTPTSVFLVTVTNTLSITPSALINSPTTQRTLSASTSTKDSGHKESSTWLIVSPALNNTANAMSTPTAKNASVVALASSIVFYNITMESLTSTFVGYKGPVPAEDTTTGGGAISTRPPISGGFQLTANYVVKLAFVTLAGIVLT